MTPEEALQILDRATSILSEEVGGRRRETHQLITQALMTLQTALKGEQNGDDRSSRARK